MKWSKDLEFAVSCGLSSIGLMFARAEDRKLMKVYLYSRGVISVLKIGQELGYYECVRERDERRFVTAETMICMASMIFLCYCYLFEINAMPKSFVATMTKACGLAPDEMRFFDSLRAIREISR